MAANIKAINLDPTDHPEDEEHVDGCACGAQIHANEATPDDQLPAASGGVAVIETEIPNEDNIDGCSVVASNEIATPDEELPVAVGGVM